MHDRNAIVNVLFEQAQEWTTLGDATRYVQVLTGLIAADELSRPAAMNISWAAFRYNGGDLDANGLRRVIEMNVPA